MATKPFDSTIISQAQEAMDFMANVLEASREYSVINKDLDGKILFRNEGARRFYGHDPAEVVTQGEFPDSVFRRRRCPEPMQSAKEQKESLCAKEMKNETKQIH